MTTGTGVDLIGSWFETGTDREIALLFIVTSTIELITAMAVRSKIIYELYYQSMNC